MIIRKRRPLRDRREQMSKPSRVNCARHYDTRRVNRDACIARPSKVIKDDETTDLIEILKGEGVEIKDLIACVKAFLESKKGDETEEKEELPDEIEESDDEVETDEDLESESVVSFDSKKAVGSLLKKTNDAKPVNNTDVADAWINRYSK